MFSTTNAPPEIKNSDHKPNTSGIMTRLREKLHDLKESTRELRENTKEFLCFSFPFTIGSAIYSALIGEAVMGCVQLSVYMDKFCEYARTHAPEFNATVLSCTLGEPEFNYTVNGCTTISYDEPKDLLDACAAYAHKEASKWVNENAGPYVGWSLLAGAGLGLFIAAKRSGFFERCFDQTPDNRSNNSNNLRSALLSL